MRHIALISTCCDLSEAALEDAWTQLAKPQPSICILYVGTKQAGAARTAWRGVGERIRVYVTPDWTTEWMLVTPYAGVFSEGT